MAWLKKVFTAVSDIEVPSEDRVFNFAARANAAQGIAATTTEALQSWCRQIAPSKCAILTEQFNLYNVQERVMNTGDQELIKFMNQQIDEMREMLST